MKYIYTTITFALLAAAASAQCEINVQIKGLRDTDLYLGYRFENKHYVADTARVDSKGKAVFKNKTARHKGIYFVVLPNRQSFDFLMTDNQKFSVTTDTAALRSRTPSQPYIQFKNSPENTQFVVS
ncbi:hypothetical protein FACS189467_4590 [Bacteroidia bacterium]|nr:hypothetical protein FACS189467_4590 [Bacteroidia bacterium]